MDGRNTDLSMRYDDNQVWCVVMMMKIVITVVRMMTMITIIMARKMTTLVRIPVQCRGRNTDLPDLGLPISNQ